MPAPLAAKTWRIPSDAADVVTFMRNRWGNQAPGVTATQIAKLFKTTNPTSDQVIILKMR